jgi:IPT/TIG domain
MNRARDDETKRIVTECKRIHRRAPRSPQDRAWLGIRKIHTAVHRQRCADRIMDSSHFLTKRSRERAGTTAQSLVMSNESFDPDATPVDGTRATRAWNRPTTTGLRPLPPSVRRLARHDDDGSRLGISKTFAFVLAGALVILIALVIINLSAPSLFSGLRNVTKTPHGSRKHAPAAGHHSSPGTKPSGPGPVLTAISPQTATPGSTIELSGSGFFSANHQIVARVAGAPAPTRCPTEELCYVVLPTAPKGTSESSVQLVTETGTSNSLEVRYG